MRSSIAILFVGIIFLTSCGSSSTLEELKTVYTSLTPSLQKDNEVIAKKDELKNRLT